MRREFRHCYPKCPLVGDRLINLAGTAYATLAEAKAAGAPTINYGVFLNTVIDFVIIAFVIFLIIRQVNRMQQPAPEAGPSTKECVYCLSAIPIKAARCAHCASELRTT
ncbi:MAG: MscL family protein [Acidobacteria bacterium]|nr:MscL family protein [Acidobacteriota bacterium]